MTFEQDSDAGIDKAPECPFMGRFTGSNTGKMFVKLTYPIDPHRVSKGRGAAREDGTACAVV